MLLDDYKAQERFWLTNVFGTPSTAGLQSFRGDFMVKEGEFKEAAGKRNPPEALLKQAVILADEGKIRMIAGNFASIDELPEFLERFKGDLGHPPIGSIPSKPLQHTAYRIRQ